MGNADNRVNPAAHVKVPFNFHKTGLHGGNKVIEDLISHRFMKSAFIAEAPKVKFQTFKFHAKFVRNIGNADDREIRLAGLGANTGKLRALKADFIITLGPGVGKHIQLFRRFGRHGDDYKEETLKINGFVLSAQNRKADFSIFTATPSCFLPRKCCCEAERLGFLEFKTEPRLPSLEVLRFKFEKSALLAFTNSTPFKNRVNFKLLG